MHAVGLALSWGVLWLLFQLGMALGKRSAVRAIRNVGVVKSRLVSQFSDLPTWVDWLVTLLAFELGFFMAASLAMSWCARDEKPRAAQMRALKRLFLLTPHAAVVIVLSGMAVTVFDLFPRAYEAPGYRTAALLLVIVAVALWSAWVVLNALTYGQASAACRWPAGCEGCGYPLIGLLPTQDCPECGLSIAKTLNETARPGIAAYKGFFGWLRLTWQAVRRPTLLGGNMHIYSPDPNPMRHMTITTVLLMLIAYGGAWSVIMTAWWMRANAGRSWHLNPDEFAVAVVIIGSVIGLGMVAALMLFALGGAGVIGELVGKPHGRNLMPAAARAARCLSGFAVFWALVFWANAAIFVIVMELDLLTPIATRYQLSKQDIVLTWLVGVVWLGIGIYLYLMYRATRAARFANW